MEKSNMIKNASIVLKWLLVSLLVCIILYYIVIVIVFRVKSKFWYLQPCYHFYDFHYSFYKNQIINKDLPKINSYVSFEKVITLKPEDISNETFQYIVDLLKKEYYHVKDGKYTPTIDTVMPYLKKNNYNSSITLAVSPTYIGGKENNNIIKYNDIVGCIMSKPLHIRFSGTSEPNYVYYVDFFCIKKEYRKLGYSEIMIQSHEYFNRHNNKNIQIHLFKREGDLTGIVPLVKYTTYLYPLPLQEPSKKFLYNISDIHSTTHPVLIQLNKKNIQSLFDYIKNLQLFDVLVYTCVNNLIELIETKNVFCFLLKDGGDIAACYFFRDTRMEVSGKLAISCFATIKNDLLEQTMFMDGFLQSINIIQKENNDLFFYLFIEDISHNHFLLKEEVLGNSLSSSQTAYFLYNYISQPVSHKKMLFI
jgi:hypothetical protein